MCGSSGAADSPDKLESLTERPLSDPPRSVPDGSFHLGAPPRRERTGRRRVNRPTHPKNVLRTHPGATVRRQCCCSLDGGAGGGWSVGPVAAGVVLVIGCARARPGATRACALARAAADRRATRGASGSSRRPHGPRSSPAGAAARRSRGTPKCPTRTRGGASPPRRNTVAARRRPAARRPSGCGARRTARRRRHPVRRVLDDDRAAVAAPARGEGAVVEEQVDARSRDHGHRSERDDRRARSVDLGAFNPPGRRGTAPRGRPARRSRGGDRAAETGS